jgi:hypothetical protein
MADSAHGSSEHPRIQPTDRYCAENAGHHDSTPKFATDKATPSILWILRFASFILVGIGKSFYFLKDGGSRFSNGS